MSGKPTVGRKSKRQPQTCDDVAPCNGTGPRAAQLGDGSDSVKVGLRPTLTLRLIAKRWAGEA